MCMIFCIQFTTTPLGIGLGTLLRWGELNKNKLYPHVFEFVTLVDQISGSPESKINQNQFD